MKYSVFTQRGKHVRVKAKSINQAVLFSGLMVPGVCLWVEGANGLTEKRWIDNRCKIKENINEV